MASGHQSSDLYIFDFDPCTDDQITDVEDNDEATSSQQCAINDHEPPALPTAKYYSSTDGSATSANAEHGQHEQIDNDTFQRHQTEHDNYAFLSAEESDDAHDESLKHSQNKSQLCNTNRDHLILKELKRVNKTLGQLQRRLESTEDSVKSLQTEVSTLAKKKKSSSTVKATEEIRRETRRVYGILMESTDFNGWDLTETFRSDHNQMILQMLMQEVKTLNDSYEAEQIKAAAYRYFRSRSQEESKKRRGIDDHKTKRKRERLVRKLQERKAMFAQMEISDRDREKWEQVLELDYMSSEDTDEENKLKVRPLPWLSERVQKFKDCLDCEIEKKMNPQSKRQRKTKTIGTSSSRPKPTVPKNSNWILK